MCVTGISIDGEIGIFHGILMRDSIAAGMFARSPLETIDQSVEIVLERLKHGGRAVRQAQQLQRIIVDPALDILVPDTAELNTSIYALELIVSIIVGKMGDRYLNGNKLRFVVAVVIEAGFHIPVSPVLHIRDEQPVTNQVEQQYPQ